MSAPKLSRAERRKVIASGIHAPERLKAHVEQVVHGIQLVLGFLAGVLIVVILVGAVLAVAFQ